jgi:hypothetical protein
MTIDDETIERMRDAYVAAREWTIVCICSRALGGMIPYRVWYAMDDDGRELLGSMPESFARDYCARAATPSCAQDGA